MGGLPQHQLCLAVAAVLTRHTCSQCEARTRICVDGTVVGHDVCTKIDVDLGDGRMCRGALIADELTDSLCCNATGRSALDAALAAPTRDVLAPAGV